MPEPQEQEMTIAGHLNELRSRLLRVLLVFALALIAGLSAAEPVYRWILSTGQRRVSIELHALSLWDGIGIYMKISFILALAASLPFMLYQIWKFVSPGLKPIERSAALRCVPYVFLLFVAGVVFAYFVVVPMALYFTASVNRSMGLLETYGAAQYFSFVFNIVLPVSALFEMPVMVMFLTRVGLLTPGRMRKWRKPAYFLLVFIAVVITPPDFISDLLVTIPLLLLYECSVYISAVVYRRQLQRSDPSKD
ncbi:twin-arginine translocase subunit TatC [Paenibacillus sp. P96]|uniref:Sec-independent protein translocase protein TatC n=1 Tax=Paenibacillus zeirhizosphaerae TaxID=2987519 RepID=A0ABT9FWA3_9BACL|nr:twin-arginine translocase subunit TatC [Paenibacillus sp. P96]MDP4098915.1 twin-arginine translocase subunit TatC [Paenibacillus sp. P96]